MKPIYGKLAWAALCTASAALAVGIEVDREGRYNLAFAQLVPAPFQADALALLAHDAYDRGQVREGMLFSRLFVRRRPIPAEGLSLLAYGQLQSHDENGALASILLAAQRGWRDRFTQDMLINLALQSGEWDIAAERIIALWRLGNSDDALKSATAELLSHPGGIAAFNKTIGQEKYWANRFLLWAGSNLDISTLGAVSMEMAKNEARVDCAALSAKALDLVRTDRPKAAEILWRTMCGSARSNRSDSFDFNDDNLHGRPVGPFEWQYPEEPGLDREVDRTAGTTLIRYENRNAVRTIIAKRNAVLIAGAHSARIEGAAKGEAGFRPLVLRISCYLPNGTSFRLIEAEVGAGPTLFDVPGENCASQELSLLSSRGSGEIRGLVVK